MKISWDSSIRNYCKSRLETIASPKPPAAAAASSSIWKVSRLGQFTTRPWGLENFRCQSQTAKEKVVKLYIKMIVNILTTDWPLLY